MISVCLATYNGEKYLREQLDSILCQLSESDEVVISDDGSSDGTINIIKSYNDNRIKLYYNQEKHGFITNFENAFKHVTGDYIFLSDQDDVWMPNKVKTVLSFLTTYDLVVHDALLIDGKGDRLGITYYSTLHHHTGLLANLVKTRFLGCCMAFKKRVLEEALPLTSLAHDYWIGMIALLKYKVFFMDDVLNCYRRHDNNVSSASGRSNNSLFEKVSKRFRMVLELSKRLLF